MALSASWWLRAAIAMASSMSGVLKLSSIAQPTTALVWQSITVAK